MGAKSFFCYGIMQASNAIKAEKSVVRPGK